MLRSFILRIVLIALLALNYESAFCQSEHFLKLRVGINLTQFNSDNTVSTSVFFPERTSIYFQNTKAKPSLSTSFNYEIAFENRISISLGYALNRYQFDTELLYDSITSIGIIQLDHSFDVQTWSVPLKIGYNFGNHFQILPKIGLQLSRLSNITRSGLFVQGIDPDPQSTYFATFEMNDGTFEKWDISWLISLDFLYKINRVWYLESGASFWRSLRDINKSFNGGTQPVYIEGVSFNLGLKYQLKK